MKHQNYHQLSQSHKNLFHSLEVAQLFKLQIKVLVSIIGKEIGKGAYASVKLVTLKETGEKYAMKIYEKFKLLDKTKKNAVDREIAIMKKIDHENIVKLKEVITTNKEVSYIYIYKTQ